MLSGTVLPISAGPGDLLQVHVRQGSGAELHRGVTLT
jgi:hypothetical protein